MLTSRVCDLSRKGIKGWESCSLRLFRGSCITMVPPWGAKLTALHQAALHFPLWVAFGCPCILPGLLPIPDFYFPSAPGPTSSSPTCSYCSLSCASPAVPPARWYGGGQQGMSLVVPACFRLHCHPLCLGILGILPGPSPYVSLS